MVTNKGGAILLLAVVGTATIYSYTTKFESDMRKVFAGSFSGFEHTTDSNAHMHAQLTLSLTHK